MDDLLKELLNKLEIVGETHEELYDSEVREQMGNAIFDGFIRPKHGYLLPDAFGLYTDDGNSAVKDALAEYILAANAKASEIGLSSFHDRLASFQNPDVKSESTSAYYDDFFGYSRPEAFDSLGNVFEVQ